MAQNIGTLVSAAIRPNDEFDPIATAYGNEIKGGLHSYETIGEIQTIITSRREWGMLASVYNEGANNGTYKLTYGYFNTDITDNANWVKTSIDTKSTTEWVDSVISILTIEPLLEPNLGDRYLLGTTSSVAPTGALWTGIDATTIVEYNIQGFWDITYPTNGMTVRVDSDNNLMYKYTGTFPDGEWKLERITNVFYIEPSSSNGITYSTTTNPKFTSYTNDLIFLTKFFTPNIGSASLSINGLGYKQIKIATTSGLRDLILTDIDTTSIYSLSYNGTYFQLTKPFPSDAHNIEFYIAATETMTVGDYEQYWVYGDLTIAGNMVNYGKVIVANGSIILQGSGTLNNQGDGEVILVDLFNTPTFNTTSTIQMSSTMTVNGPSVSAVIVDNSITTNLLNTVGGVTASYLLSNDGGGSFKWVAPTVGGSDTNSNLFYNSGGTVSATNSTSAIYRTGSLNIGSGTVYGSRFVVSSTTGSVSFVVDNGGNIYNYDSDVMANTKFGYAALYLNTTGTSNTSFGNQALKANTTGSYNTAVGVASLVNNDSGYSNTALGYYSLYSNSVGVSNTAIGNNSLYSNTTGYSNTAVGSVTLYYNTTGYNNTAIGNYSLFYNTTGYFNTAIGYNSLYSNTIGTQNTAIGISSLYSNTIGNYNTAIGYQSLYSNTSGNYNTAVGLNSLFYNKGSNNTALGYSAGTTISGTTSGATNSNNSIFIGYDTRPSTGNNTNEIVIGYGATGNCSNTVTLGNDSVLRTYLKGSVVIADGTQGSGKVLVSDSNGVGTWTMSSVRSYVTILSQSGTASPTEIAVVNNTLGVTLTWSYLSVGQYRLTSSSPIFDLNKMWWSSYVGTSNGETLSGGPVNSTIFDVICRVSGALADSYLSGAPFKIEVYN